MNNGEMSNRELNNGEMNNAEQRHQGDLPRTYSSLFSHFNAVQISQFMTVVDACHVLQTKPEFVLMIQGPLRGLVPHRYAACGIGERGKLTIDYIVNVDFPERYLTTITSKRASKFMLNSPVARDWADLPQTRFVSGLRNLNPDYPDWTQAVELYGIDNMLVSGLHDLSGGKTSYFCFACCEEGDPEWMGYLIDLVTPHLHKALCRIGNFEFTEPTDTCELTVREKEILHLVVVGLGNIEIGKNLCISENTVKNHVRSIFKKLHVVNRVQAVSRAYSLNLLDVNHLLRARVPV